MSTDLTIYESRELSVTTYKNIATAAASIARNCGGASLVSIGVSRLERATTLASVLNQVRSAWYPNEWIIEDNIAHFPRTLIRKWEGSKKVFAKIESIVAVGIGQDLDWLESQIQELRDLKGFAKTESFVASPSITCQSPSSNYEQTKMSGLLRIIGLVGTVAVGAAAAGVAVAAINEDSKSSQRSSILKGALEEYNEALAALRIAIESSNASDMKKTEIMEQTVEISRRIPDKCGTQDIIGLQRGAAQLRRLAARL